MKKVIFLMLFYMTNLSLNAQVWVDSGAVWHYQSIDIWGVLYYLKQTYEKDTSIGGQFCQKIKIESQSFLPAGTASVYYTSGIVEGTPQFTYVNGDTVFYLASDSVFRILYNFGAQVGDSWDVSIDDDNNPNTQDTSRVIVEGINLASGFRQIQLGMATCSHKLFIGTFNERYGFVGPGDFYEYGDSPFPNNWACNMSVESGHIYICSFSDATFQLNSNTGTDCQYPNIEVLNTELFTGERVKVFPNPAKTAIQFSGIIGQNINLSLLDLTGKVVFEAKHVKHNTPIDISILSSGFYLLRMNDNGEVLTKQLIIE